MRRSSVKEYTETMLRHYTGASRTEKSRLLDELATTESRPSGLLSDTKPTKSAKRRGRPVYGRS